MNSALVQSRELVTALAGQVTEPHRYRHVTTIVRVRDGFSPSSVSLPLPAKPGQLEREYDRAVADLADFTDEPHEVRTWIEELRPARRSHRRTA